MRETAIMLADVPRIDRFFPNCFFGLIELAARWKYGLRDIKKAWLNHGFTYDRPPGQLRVRPDGLNLDVTLSSPDVARRQIDASLDHYYGLRVEKTRYEDFDVVVRTLRELLEAGELPI